MVEPILAKKSQTKSALQRHIAGECGCSVLANPRSCPYQPFLDGWDFTPEVGNGQSRGEIFTPRYVVDRMVVDSGMLPPEAVYKYAYHRASKKQALAYVLNRVVEPAVGTANFTATILWHKLHYARQAAMRDGQVGKVQYDLHATQALASLYAYDIDAGNLQATKHRLLRTSDIYTGENVIFWVNHVLEAIARRLDRGQKITLEQQVTDSLLLASNNWDKSSQSAGIMERLYEEHVGEAPAVGLKALWSQILSANVKLFNGIQEHDLVEENSFIPGWQNINWYWWTFKPDARGFTIPSFTMESLAKQIQAGRLVEVEGELRRLREAMVVPEGDLTGEPVFESERDRKHYEVRLRALKNQQEKFAGLDAKIHKRAEEKSKPIAKLTGLTLF